MGSGIPLGLHRFSDAADITADPLREALVSQDASDSGLKQATINLAVSESFVGVLSIYSMLGPL